MTPISRGFRGRPRSDVDPARVPPGQYVVQDFPVLSAGPTPHTPLQEWSFHDRRRRRRAPVLELGRVPGAAGRDVHGRHPLRHEVVEARHGVDRRARSTPCSTPSSTEADYLTAWSDGGYTTNLALEDVSGGRAWIAYAFDGEPLEPEHGGPARLLVPHLYFWKSAKWVRGLTLHERGRARLLGGRRLPQPRRPVEGAALLERLRMHRAPIAWQIGGCARDRRRDAARPDDRPRRPRLARATWPGSTSTSASRPRTATRRSAPTRSPRRRRIPARAHRRAHRRRRGLALSDRGAAGRGRARAARADRRPLHVAHRATAARCCCSPAALAWCR